MAPFQSIIAHRFGFNRNFPTSLRLVNESLLPKHPHMLLFPHSSLTFALCFFLSLITGLYIQLVSKLMSQNSGLLVWGQSIKCGDMKLCSSMFRRATLSHNLSYDLSNDKIEEMCM